MIDFLLWSLERLSSFDLENDFLFKFIKFIINLLHDHFEHLCRSESLIAFSKSSMNILKKINHSSLWNYSHSISMLSILNIYHDIRLLILFDDDWLNIPLTETLSIQLSLINHVSMFQLIFFFISSEKDEDQHFSHHVRSFSF